MLWIKIRCCLIFRNKYFLLTNSILFSFFAPGNLSPHFVVVVLTWTQSKKDGKLFDIIMGVNVSLEQHSIFNINEKKTKTSCFSLLLFPLLCTDNYSHLSLLLLMLCLVWAQSKMRCCLTFWKTKYFLWTKFIIQF